MHPGRAQRPTYIAASSACSVFWYAIGSIIHRHVALKDSDIVPDDNVDVGEEGKADDLDAQDAPLSYLWVLDRRSSDDDPSKRDQFSADHGPPSRNGRETNHFDGEVKHEKNSQVCVKQRMKTMKS